MKSYAKIRGKMEQLVKEFHACHDLEEQMVILDKINLLAWILEDVKVTIGV